LVSQIGDRCLWGKSASLGRRSCAWLRRVKGRGRNSRGTSKKERKQASRRNRSKSERREAAALGGSGNEMGGCVYYTCLTHLTYACARSPTLPRSPAGVTRASATIPEMLEQRRLSRVPRVARSLSRVGRPLGHGRCASSLAKGKGLWSAETAPRRHPRGIMLAVPFVGAATNWDCQRDHGRVFGRRLHPPVHVRCVVSRRVLCA
jgi:hypothetical protein